MNKRKVIFRFFLTYFFIILPILLFTIIMATNTANRMKKDVYHVLSSQLNKVSNQLLNEYKDYEENSIRLYSHRELLGDKMTSSRILARIGIEELERVNDNDSYTTDVFMYYGDDHVYSAMGLSKVDVHFKYVMGCTEESSLDGRSLLKIADNKVDILYTAQSGYLLYHYKNKNWASDVGSSVNYAISFGEFKEKLERLVNGFPAYIIVTVNDDKKIYLKYTDEKELVLLEGEEIPLVNKLKGYTVISDTVVDMDMKIEVAYQSDQVYSVVTHNQKINILIIAISVFVTMLVSFYIGKKRYQSIKMLERDLKERKYSDKKYEYSFVESIMNTIVHESDDWQKKAIESQTRVKRQVAMQLFYGIVKEAKGINTLLENTQIELYEDYYFIGGIYINGVDIETEKFSNIFETDLYCKAPVNGQTAMLFLFESPNEDYLFQKRNSVVQRLVEAGELEEVDGVRIAFSQMYQNISMVSYAYMEAVSTLWKMSNNKSKPMKVEFWENILKSEDEVSQFTEKDITCYNKALQDNNKEEIEASLKHMQQYIYYQVHTEETKSYLRFCLLQPLIMMVKSQHETQVSEKLISDAIKYATSSDKDFQKTINKIVVQYCKKPKKQNDFTKVIQYVDNNFTRYDLSLDEVAEYSGFTKAYLSRLFKSKVGKGYSQYVTGLRMNKAKDLLVETDLSIKEIVPLLGYIDVPNFRKRFKKECEMTPCAYRKEFRRD